MAYVSVPKDLSKIRSKVLFNLTKRQIICFGSGALLGVPLFFLFKGAIGTSPAAMLMMVVMLPAFLLGMYEKNGQPLEVVLCPRALIIPPYDHLLCARVYTVIQLGVIELFVSIKNIYAVCFQRPKVRPYRTNNFYSVLERQERLEREVYQIVHGQNRGNKTDKRGEKADRRADRKGKRRG